jgi:hypothetical protein
VINEEGEGGGLSTNTIKLLLPPGGDYVMNYPLNPGDHHMAFDQAGVIQTLSYS